MNRHFPKRNRGSITTRLIVNLTVGTTILWCLATAFATYASYQELNETFDASVRATALRLLPLAEDDFLGQENDDTRAIHRFMDGRETHLGYQLRNSSGKILLRARDAPSVPYDPDLTDGFSTVGNSRLYSRTDSSTGLTITVAESTHNRREAVFASIQAMLWPLLALVPMNALAIWLGVRRGMNPVRRLRDDIAARGSENLAPLDVSDQPKELRPIADAVARLVERLGIALDAERAFSANSAHELRTPIAGALAQTQRLIAELKGPGDRRRAEEIESTLKRLSRLSEKLLQLSRVDAGIGLNGEAVDLAPILDIVVADASARCQDAGRIAYARNDAGLVARIDPDAFAIAVRNLIDNALIHGAESDLIEIVVEPGCVIRIINDGPAVSAESLAGLTRRFSRGRTDVVGSGLGLAIVETIMQQVGGKLQLFSPAQGRDGGFEARLVLTAPA